MWIRKKYILLPNTAGCFNAEEVVRVARLGREMLTGSGVSGGGVGEAGVVWRIRRRCCRSRWGRWSDWHTQILVKDGFQVLVYCE